jgi:hypothetical protein
MATAPPKSKVHLLQNRANAFHTVGELELTDTTLRCVLKQHSGWVEKELGIDDLKSRIKAGEEVVAFEFDRGRMEVEWPKQFGGGGFSVSQGDSRKWLCSLATPTGFWSIWDLMTERRIFKAWRAALAEPAVTPAA